MCGENASNPAETVLMVIATSWTSHAHAEAAAAAQTASDAWAYISGSTFASAMREAEHMAVQLTQIVVATAGSAFLNAISEPAQDRKKGGADQSTTQKALVSSEREVAPIMTATASDEEHPRTTRRATMTLAALFGHEYSSSAIPFCLLECTVGAPTSTVIAERIPIAIFMAVWSPDEKAIVHMSATSAACAIQVHAGT